MRVEGKPELLQVATQNVQISLCGFFHVVGVVALVANAHA